MLVLTRKTNEAITIGEDIEITILSIHGDQVKIGINAPKKIDIHRKEVFIAIKEENHEAVKTVSLDSLKNFIRKS
ncbi:carbon storage regulator CsrA [Alkalihalobacillus trypoxylicola]|uniref:Translational regulator CsrA n=1 Tax=Alkalihalobacillus trypoxylicola TaxID=519424 RepID=A0A162ETQ2_9BACI|nr:carbon storage regulator CsrA [Alkalihalobacillus trypoxylicola]KYG33699.1 carbon storage regulator [Alkalihalobacillus trypoxylicola]GAF67099.1 carbon storage regulator [Bacillus sp. TS-2]